MCVLICSVCLLCPCVGNNGFVHQLKQVPHAQLIHMSASTALAVIKSRADSDNAAG